MEEIVAGFPPSIHGRNCSRISSLHTWKKLEHLSSLFFLPTDREWRNQGSGMEEPEAADRQRTRGRTWRNQTGIEESDSE